MKLRLKSREFVVRISEEEASALAGGERLSECFWITPHRKFELTLIPADQGSWHAAGDALAIEISKTALFERDPGPEPLLHLAPNENYSVVVEVDLFRGVGPKERRG